VESIEHRLQSIEQRAENRTEECGEQNRRVRREETTLHTKRVRKHHEKQDSWVGQLGENKKQTFTETVAETTLDVLQVSHAAGTSSTTTEGLLTPVVCRQGKRRETKKDGEKR